MSHFAVIDLKTNIVVSVIAVDKNKLIVDEIENEKNGIDFLNKVLQNIYSEKNYYYAQCSYSKISRKNYPGPGFTYDKTRNAFIAPKPTHDNNFILNEETYEWIQTK